MTLHGNSSAMRWAFGIVLATSLGLNGYLVLAETSRVPTSPTLPLVKAPPEPPLLPPVLRRRPTLATVELDRGALEQRLAKAEARLEDLLPAQEKFEKEERIPKNEERARAVLDQHGLGKYQIECRQTVCLFKPDQSVEDWMSTLQTRVDIATNFAGMSFGPFGAHMRINKAPPAPEYRFRLKLLVALAESPAYLECGKVHPTPGEIHVAFKLDPTTRRVSAVTAGPLAEQPVGLCLRSR